MIAAATLFIFLVIILLGIGAYNGLVRILEQEEIRKSLPSTKLDEAIADELRTLENIRETRALMSEDDPYRQMYDELEIETNANIMNLRNQRRALEYKQLSRKVRR